MSTKPLIIAALAATTAFGGIAFAQQATPANPSANAQVQAQQSDEEEVAEDARPPRVRDGGDRWDRRHEDRAGSFEDMMRERMTRRCERGGRFSERMIDRIERATRPTEQQKPAFDKLREAATKAAETVRAACPTEVSLTPPGRLAAAEKRLTAMLDAVRTVRPAMDAYYNSLSDEQKARLYLSRRPMMGPTGDRHGWRGGPERGEPRDNTYRNPQRGEPRDNTYRNPERAEPRDNTRRNPEREGYRERQFDRRPNRGDDEPRGNRPEVDENQSEPL